MVASRMCADFNKALVPRPQTPAQEREEQVPRQPCQSAHVADGNKDSAHDGDLRPPEKYGGVNHISEAHDMNT